jgi:hypothetical protein
MKRLAGYHHEDILQVSLRRELATVEWPLTTIQCSMPTFDGLFERIDYNDIVQDLLYVLAFFHALIKLRLQTEESVEAVRAATPVLGSELRRFKADMCDEITTKETPRERAARLRREAKVAEKLGRPIATGGGEGRAKELNLNTLKIHRMGHIADTIANYGTTDSYDSRMVSGFCLCLA